MLSVRVSGGMPEKNAETCLGQHGRICLPLPGSPCQCRRAWQENKRGKSTVIVSLTAKRRRSRSHGREDLLVQPSTVGELLPMVAADQLEGMSVGIAEIETLVVFSPMDTAFNGNTVLGEVRLPLAHLCCLDGESDMHGPGAIVRRKDASRHCCWLQRGLFFEEQKNLVICHLQSAEPILLLEDDGKAEELTVPFGRTIKIGHIETSFENSACRRYHNRF
jgi:hypothetical protein